MISINMTFTFEEFQYRTAQTIGLCAFIYLKKSKMEGKKEG
jgi:hypothetical protein